MIANFEYGNFDITLCDKYKITNYKDCVLSSGSVLTDEETHDDLEDVLEYMDPKRKLKVKSGTKVGIFYCEDEYDEDLAYGGYKLHGEVNFTNDSVIYNNASNDDYTGEVSEWVIMLGDDRFVTSGGEYSIITKENSEDELNKFNQAIGKNFDIIILSNS
jgi:hypothetical protein